MTTPPEMVEVEISLTGQDKFEADLKRITELVDAYTGKKQGVLMGATISWFAVALILGTVLGVWIKLFWIGWVFAG
jgi:hypothetical protein